ncbi:MAG: hypothetical protein ACE5NM_04290 [Sedimentisphaerales bacterium]
MGDWFTILIGSSLLGILITTFTNCIISLKTLHAQQRLQTHKAALDFLKEKIDELRKTRSSLSERTPIKPLVEAIKSQDSMKLIGYLRKEVSDYYNEASSYKDIRIYFSSENRKKLDDWIKRIASFNTEVGEYLLDNVKEMRMAEKVPDQILKKFVAMGESMSEFRTFFLDAVDNELASAADKLSNCV